MLRVADDPDVGFTEAVLATDGGRVAGAGHHAPLKAVDRGA